MAELDEEWEGIDHICVDFDGTLTKGKAKHWEGETAEPNPEMIEWVKDSYYSGKIIVIWTARPWSQASNIAARLTEWDVPYHGIRCAKGGATYYIDDKAMRPEEILDG